MVRGPSRLLMMRHAEKPPGAKDPGDPDEELSASDSSAPSDPNLSPAGYARAKQLVTWVPQIFGKPDAIVATANSSQSYRPLETVQPLAQSVGLKVQQPYGDDDFSKLPKWLDDNCTGMFVVICWHHGKLPSLAQLLQVTGVPEPWPGNVFDWVFSKGPITEPF
jgi:hypothetical protein